MRRKNPRSIQFGHLRVKLRIIGFVDDAEFVLNPERREIDVRFASRLGYYDLGKNRRRLEEFRREFSVLSWPAGGGPCPPTAGPQESAAALVLLQQSQFLSILRAKKPLQWLTGARKG